MGMFHSTSGKLAYNLFCSPGVDIFPREKLREVLIKEDQLRHAKSIQELYSKQFATGNEYLHHIRDVTIELQKQALRDCGFPEETLSIALPSFQCHRAHYQDDEELLKVSKTKSQRKCKDLLV
jgi:hypothetical protein